MGLIPAGVLRDTLTVLRSVKTSNGRGGWTDDWQPVGTVRGQITARSSRGAAEPMEAAAPSSEVLVDFVLDDAAVGLRTSDRIRNADGDFELISVTRQASLCMGVGRKA